MAAKKAKPAVVLTGSELNGAEEDIASWAGIQLPDDKWDAYGDLMGSVRALSLFFSSIKNGWFEVTEEEDDMGPGLNDTYWTISTHDPEALRAEIHERLVEELQLRPARKGRPKPAGSRARKKAASKPT